MTQKIAVVTGGNRGIGLEICRQLAQQPDIKVILTSRDEEKGQVAVNQLKSEGLKAQLLLLDITDPESIAAFITIVQGEYGRFDILINNAGIFLDKGQPGLSVDLNTVRRTIETNVYGALQLCQAAIPLMKKHNYGRIVNVSSKLSQLSEIGGSGLAYRTSKIALNGITAILAQEVADTNILINTASPGWVRTEMGGDDAPRTVTEGADTMVWLALLPDDGPSGLFFEDRTLMAW